MDCISRFGDPGAPPIDLRKPQISNDFCRFFGVRKDSYYSFIHYIGDLEQGNEMGISNFVHFYHKRRVFSASPRFLRFFRWPHEMQCV